MSENLSLYHVLAQLIQELKVIDAGSIDSVLEKISEKGDDSALSEIERQKILEKVSKSCEDPQKFMRIYETLKTKNYAALDKVLRFLVLIVNNPKMKNFLMSQRKKNHQKFMNMNSLSNNLKKLKISVSEVPSMVPEMEMHKTETVLPVIENLYQDRSRTVQSIKATITKSDTSFLIKKEPRDQELLVVEDIIFVLLGCDGRFIYYNEASESFVIDKHLNERIVSTIQRILPLLTARHKINSFREKFPPCVGTLVQQAFSYAVFSIETEFATFVCQMEEMFRNGELNLQKLLYLKESCIEEIEFISKTCAQIEKCQYSHEILSILHEKLELAINSGVCLKTCELFISTASKPYFDMVGQWIYHGVIKDPYKEFMIYPNSDNSYTKIYSRDNLWGCLHILDQDKIPVFLRPVADKIFNAGRYLNVLFQCGVAIKDTSETPLVYTFYGHEYYKIIDLALSNASKTLLNFIIIEKRFLDFLKSIRHFFLLDHGDFFTIFIDSAENILIKPRSEIEISKLESLLELAIRNSVFSGDPFSDHVGVILLEEDLMTRQLQILGNSKQTKITESDGIRSMAFTFAVDWPFSLIISSMAITKYQMIFRHLLNIKYCSHILARHWQTVSKEFLKINCAKSRKNLSLIQIVTNKMLHFLQNFEYFIQCDVINPNWIILMTETSNSESIDDLISSHTNFLDIILKDCMLTHSKLVEGFSNVINLCYNFPAELQKFNGKRDSLEFFELIDRYHENLIESVSSFIYLLYGRNSDHFEHNMLTLVQRLDFNNFYSDIRSQDVSMVNSSASY